MWFLNKKEKWIEEVVRLNTKQIYTLATHLTRSLDYEEAMLLKRDYNRLCREFKYEQGLNIFEREVD